MNKAVLFVRVSTLQQHLESQEDALRRAAKADGFCDKDIIVIGKKESAIKLEDEEREGLKELKEVMSSETIDCIYIFELSRLSRKPITLYSIREQLRKAHVQLKCLNPSFTLLNSDRTDFDNTATLVFSLFAAMAEQEMIEKKERFHRGKRRLADEGRYNGGAIPFGYRIAPEKNNLIVIDDDDAATVREVFNLYESGVSQPQLAREFYRRGNKKMTISFINNVLNNERYTGSKHCYAGSSFERSYPVIITPEQFKRCRKIARDNSTTADKTRNVYYANKLIVCTECGCYWSASGSKVLYKCYDAFNVMRKYDHYKTPQCTCRLNISINIMDSLLWYVAQKAEARYILSAATEDKQMYESQIDNLNKKIDFIQERLSDLDKKKSRIVESYIDGHIDKAKRDERFQQLDLERKDILLDQAQFLSEKEHIEALLNDINITYKFSDVNAIANQLEFNMALIDRIAAITDDKERSQIVHRHVKKVSIRNSAIEYEFGIGRKLTKTRFITIEFFNGDINYFQFIPNTGGKGGIILNSTAKGKPLDRISFQYLGRFFDEGKIRRRKEAREHKVSEKETLYPSDKYVLGVVSFAKFLNISTSSACRWLYDVGLFEQALLGKYNKEIIIDKKICLEILHREAKQNKWIEKILNNMNHETK